MNFAKLKSLLKQEISGNLELELFKQKECNSWGSNLSVTKQLRMKKSKVNIAVEEAFESKNVENFESKILILQLDICS